MLKIKRLYTFMLQTFLPLSWWPSASVCLLCLCSSCGGTLTTWSGKVWGFLFWRKCLCMPPYFSYRWHYHWLFCLPRLWLSGILRTIGITGYEIGGCLTCPYHAPANHHHQYYKYRGFLLPELCHACRTSQTLHATLVYAAEIAGARYSWRGFLQRNHWI